MDFSAKIEVEGYREFTKLFIVIFNDLTWEAELTALNKVKVEVNTNIATVYPSLFSIKGVNNNYFIATTISGKIVTFTTARNLKADEGFKLLAVDKILITNSYGENLSEVINGETEIPVLDKVASIIVKLETVKGNTKAIKFTFLEEVNTAKNINPLSLYYRDATGVHEVVVEAIYFSDIDTNISVVSNDAYKKIFIVYISIVKWLNNNEVW